MTIKAISHHPLAVGVGAMSANPMAVEDMKKGPAHAGATFRPLAVPDNRGIWRRMTGGAMDTKPVRIRWFWAAYLALLAVFFVWGIYPYLANPRLTMGGGPRPFQVFQTVVDLLVMYGLFGFVLRRPIRQIALRVVFIIVAAFLCVRVGVIFYIFDPWRGDAESFNSIALLLVAPLTLLPAAFALWQYATKS